MARKKAARSERSRRVRYFVLQRGGKDTPHVFTGRQPRQAALKAATRGETKIELRERGRNRVHIFVGTRARTSSPSNAPTWMPKQIWKAKVSKKGIRHLEARRRRKE
jgi:hypothetical protein